MNRARLPFSALVTFTLFVASAPSLGEDGARPAGGTGAESAFGVLKFLKTLLDSRESGSALMRDGDNLARKGDYKAAIDSYTLDLNIKESTQTRYRRAYCHVLLKKYELAIEDCTQNLAADPKDLESQRLRGWGYAHIGKTSEAIRDYEALAAAQPAGAEADHRSPSNGQPGSVRVVSRKRGLLGLLPGRRLTFDESWARVCYELHNIQGTPDFDQATCLASRGELTRDGYIRQYAFVEYQAVLRTRAFYADIYFPLVSEKKIETHPGEWRLEAPASFDDWLARYSDRSGYPWEPYGRYYDQLQKRKASEPESETPQLELGR